MWVLLVEVLEQPGLASETDAGVKKMSLHFVLDSKKKSTSLAKQKSDLPSSKQSGYVLE